MTKKPLQGIFPIMPLVLKKNQELDLEGLKENIKSFERVGFDGFIAFGCMGEFFATTEEEFNKIVDVAVDAAEKIACVFGATWHNGKECLRRTKYAENAGADGVMIAVPYLIPCTENDVFEHYRLIDEAVDEIQVMAYNYPPGFRINITTGLWDRLLTLDSIKALKESNGDVFHRIAVIKHIKHKINVFSGGEGWLLNDAIHGANSIVSTCGLGAPKASVTYYQKCMEKDLAKAVPLNHAFIDMIQDCNENNEVGWYKAAAEIGGFRAGPPRSPYAPISHEIREKLKELIKAVEALV